ncbi:MAG: hypothetical protein J6D29_03035 [Solobacterium sp.]|nr:hypothetical protein [Solobacterium sp.]
MKVLKPFIGLDEFKLLSSVEQVEKLLKQNGEKYTKEIWPNEELTNPVPWTVINTASGLSFFFANDKLFKIYVEDNTDYALENGIKIGMPLEKAKQIDSKLSYDDWNEDWASSQGYWLEDNIETGCIASITVFIKEVLNDELFDKYEW